MNRLSKISFFLFVSIYNYLWLRIILFYFYYNHLGNMGFLGILFFIVGVLLVLILLPKKLLNKDYTERFKKSYFKYFYFLILLLESIFGISVGIYILTTVFLLEATPFIALTIVMLTVAILSVAKPAEIMEISTLFSIVGYITLFVSLSLFPELEMTMLLPFKEFNYLIIPLSVLLVIGDNMSIIVSKENINFSKLNFIMAIFTALVFFALEFVMLLCSSGTEFFKGLNWVGFICLSIQPVSKYFGNFDFAYIYFILCGCLFKYTYNLSLIRNSLNIGKKIMTIILAITLSSLGLVCYFFIPLTEFMLVIISVLLIASCLILGWFIKECYFVRETKEQ